MKKKQPSSHETRVSIISLDDDQIVRSIFKGIQHSTAAHQDLRRHIFRHIAKSPKLQHMLLDVLSGHPDAQRALLQELGKNPQLKRKIVVVAHVDRKSK
ncbi:MAG TPA: hypothetical protein VFF50_00755 [Candidatus Deferrimicrobiaceae bacterium]|nr:hypothetical protein [Candidatus Deferrimicrobiaceae bacterium]